MSRHKFAYRLIFAVGILLLATLIVCAPHFAYAQLPPSYKEKVQDAGYEWWSDLLDLGEVKKTVDSWFINSSQYDFSKLDDDPIVIAVIDSGVDVEHELFSGTYGESDNADYDVLFRNNDGAIVGKNTVGENEDFSDVATASHGTHVAGIAALLIHSLGLEKYIKIMPIRAGSSKGSGAEFNVDDVKEGILFALDNGADVINMSIEATDNRQFDFVQQEWAEKAIFVASAGNGRAVFGSRQGYDSARTKCYPAASENVIGVMSISNERDADGDLQLSASSNFGDAYELCAPGVSFYSASKEAPDEYISKSGTSMAAPVVSFASALALLRYRAMEAATHNSKSMKEIWDIITSSSTQYIGKGKYRLGVLDLKALADAGDSVNAHVDIVSGNEKQHLGNLSPIEFGFNVLPATLKGKGSVEWALGDPNGEKLGEGFEFTYMPKNVLGKQIIYARWTVETDDGTMNFIASFEVTVDYAELTNDVLDDLKIGIMDENGELINSAELKKGKEYILTFADADNYSPDVTNEIKWYVGDRQIGTGKEVRFTPEVDGNYEIYVSLNGMNSAKSVVEFKANKTLAYVCYGLVAAAVLIVVVIVIISAYGHSRTEKRN